MTVLQHEYEIIIIVRPDLDDNDTNTIIEKLEAVITENGGHLLLRDEWGKRKLAYIIQKHTKGHYVLLSIVAPAALIRELERNIRNEDRVMRFMTVLLSRNVDVAARLVKAEEARQKRAEEAQARAEEAARAEAARAERERVAAEAAAAAAAAASQPPASA